MRICTHQTPSLHPVLSVCHQKKPCCCYAALRSSPCCSPGWRCCPCCCCRRLTPCCWRCYCGCCLHCWRTPCCWRWCCRGWKSCMHKREGGRGDWELGAGCWELPYSTPATDLFTQHGDKNTLYTIMGLSAARAHLELLLALLLA